jgi:mannosyl-oligosaccharide alpha-1,2-mannosidase
MTDISSAGSLLANVCLSSLSYYFAEVLKYLFLSFTDPDVVNLDDWVFNTECHPLRRNAPACGV